MKSGPKPLSRLCIAWRKSTPRSERHQSSGITQSRAKPPSRQAAKGNSPGGLARGLRGATVSATNTRWAAVSWFVASAFDGIGNELEPCPRKSQTCVARCADWSSLSCAPSGPAQAFRLVASAAAFPTRPSRNGCEIAATVADFRSVPPFAGIGITSRPRFGRRCGRVRRLDQNGPTCDIPLARRYRCDGQKAMDATIIPSSS
jgi:hypothetical protein